MRGLNGVHWSYQKLAERPFPTLHLRNQTARKRSFNIDFQIHDPCLFSSRLHKLTPFKRCSLHQEAHKDSFSWNSNQMSFRFRVLFHKMRSLSPNPPSAFGRQQFAHDILADALVVMFPFHRNLLHSDSTCLMHPFGKRKCTEPKIEHVVYH